MFRRLDREAGRYAQAYGTLVASSVCASRTVSRPEETAAPCFADAGGCVQAFRGAVVDKVREHCVAPTVPAEVVEVKWDGFRALVSTEDRLRVGSRRSQW